MQSKYLKVMTNLMNGDQSTLRKEYMQVKWAKTKNGD